MRTEYGDEQNVKEDQLDINLRASFLLWQTPDGMWHGSPEYAEHIRKHDQRRDQVIYELLHDLALTYEEGQ